MISWFGKRRKYLESSNSLFLGNNVFKYCFVQPVFLFIQLELNIEPLELKSHLLQLVIPNCGFPVPGFKQLIFGIYISTTYDILHVEQKVSHQEIKSRKHSI